jgi:UDP-3-O-[3-hydroxymyristoyl] glucosamine N-acyltransferase
VKLRLFIFGTGVHARKVFHYAAALGHEVAGFVDEKAAALPPVPGVRVFHVASLQTPAEGDAMFIAIGRSDVRKRLMDQFASAGWVFPALIHPSAWVAPDAQLEAGVLVAAGAVVETATVVGRGTIVDIGVMVDHECQVGPFCHLKPGEVLVSHTKVSSPA